MVLVAIEEPYLKSSFTGLQNGDFLSLFIYSFSKEKLSFFNYLVTLRNNLGKAS